MHGPSVNAQAQLDVYALALPHGHGFGKRPPVGAWQSDDGIAFGEITHHVESGEFGILVMRRRIDHVWSKTAEDIGFSSKEKATTKLEFLLKSGMPLEPMMPNTAPRPALFDVGTREPSDVFRVLTTPSHQIAARTLNRGSLNQQLHLLERALTREINHRQAWKYT